MQVTISGTGGSQAGIVSDKAPALLAGARRLVRELNEPITRMTTYDLCTIVTVVLLFLHAGARWYLSVPMRSLCLCAIIIPRLRNSERLWFAMLTLLVAANWRDRLLIDNHKYLMTYWVAAIFLASLRRKVTARDHILRFNGRMLIGLCFGLAVISKVVSPDYRNGGFFRSTLLVDGRFASFANIVGGVDRIVLNEAKAAEHDVRNAYILGVRTPRIELDRTGRMSVVVWFMTLWTIAIESVIAVAYLLPFKGRAVEIGRLLALCVFVVSTYAIALVPGFAWTLIVMGIAQLRPALARFRLAYVLLATVVLQLYQIHYLSLASALMGYFR